MKARKPHRLLPFAFITVMILCTHLFSQEGKLELPAELKEEVDALIQKLGDDRFAVREEAQKEVASFLQNLETFDALLLYLKQKMETAEDVEVKVRLEHIAKAYLRFGITSVLLEKFPDIITRLTSPDKEVRKTCIENLRGFHRPDAIKPLIRVLLSDGEPFLRALTAQMLGEMNDARAVEPLVNALGDEVPWVRAEAAEALGEIKDAKSTDFLIKVLSDEDENVAQAAQEALAKIGKRALDSLKGALEKETDEKIKAKLKEIIEKITKQ